jgi:hypothetical protein
MYASSETSVLTRATRHNIPEDSILQISISLHLTVNQITSGVVAIPRAACLETEQQDMKLTANLQLVPRLRMAKLQSTLPSMVID